MSSIRELERVASSYATKAVYLDRQGKTDSAITMYKRAVEMLIKITKLYPNCQLNQIYIQRAQAYQRRIKRLRGEPNGSLMEPNNPKNTQKLICDELVLTEKPNVKWSDVIGLEQVKSVIEEAIIYPTRRPDLFPLGWPRGILLFGPPGCGKTLLAAAVANEIDASFFSVDAAAIMSKWLGEAEKNVARLFNAARAVASREKPAIIFIDELDSLVRVHSSEVGGEARVRNQFLKEMDSIVDKGRRLHVYVIGATNKPWNLDWPFIRRFQKRLLVPLPDRATRLKMFRHFTKDFTLAQDVDFQRLADRTEGFSGSDIRDVCQSAQLNVIRELFRSKKALTTDVKPRPVSMRDFLDAIAKIRPSVTEEMMKLYRAWDENFGAY